MKKGHVVLLILLAVGVLFFLEKDKVPATVPGPNETGPVPEGANPSQPAGIAPDEPVPDAVAVKPKQVFDIPVQGIDARPELFTMASQQTISLS